MDGYPRQVVIDGQLLLAPAEREDLRKLLMDDVQAGHKDPMRATVAAAALIITDQLERLHLRNGGHG